MLKSMRRGWGKKMRWLVEWVRKYDGKGVCWNRGERKGVENKIKRNECTSSFVLIIIRLSHTWRHYNMTASDFILRHSYNRKLCILAPLPFSPLLLLLVEIITVQPERGVYRNKQASKERIEKKKYSVIGVGIFFKKVIWSNESARGT